MVKKFSSIDAGQDAKNRLDAAFSTFQQTLLEQCIRTKSNEVHVLKQEVSLEHVWTQFRTLVSNHAPSILKRHQLPIYKHDAATDTTVIDRWEATAAIIAIWDQVLDNCPTYTAQVISLTESSVAHKVLKIKKK